MEIFEFYESNPVGQTVLEPLLTECVLVCVVGGLAHHYSDTGECLEYLGVLDALNVCIFLEFPWPPPLESLDVLKAVECFVCFESREC